MKLSEDLRYWRAERPDEWTMDEFIRKADKLESKLQSVEAILYYVDVGDQQKAYEALRAYREQSKCKS